MRCCCCCHIWCIVRWRLARMADIAQSIESTEWSDDDTNATLICEQNDCGIHSRLLSQPRDKTFILWSFFLDMFRTHDDTKVQWKWKKVKKSDILSKIEQNWAGPPIHTLVLRAILSKIEQNWARFAEHSPILFLVVRAVLSTIEQVWAGTYDKDVPWFNLLKYWNISILLMIKRNLTHERTHSHKFLQINNHTQTVLHVSICSIFTPIHIPTIWWNWFNWRNWGTWQIWRWWGWWPWWRWWKKTRWWPGPQSMVWCLKFSGGINNSTWQL